MYVTRCFCVCNPIVWSNATVSFGAVCVVASPPWHRNARKLRARARRAVRRDSLTEEQACALLLHHGSALTRVALRIFPKDVVDVPELHCGVRARETQMHDERLQNAEAQVVARRGVRWFAGLLRVSLLAQFCWQRGVLQVWCSEKEWNSRLLPGEETGSRRNLVVMTSGRVPS